MESLGGGTMRRIVACAARQGRCLRTEEEGARVSLVLKQNSPVREKGTEPLPSNASEKKCAKCVYTFSPAQWSSGVLCAPKFVFSLFRVPSQWCDLGG